MADLSADLDQDMIPDAVDNPEAGAYAPPDGADITAHRETNTDDAGNTTTSAGWTASTGEADGDVTGVDRTRTVEADGDVVDRVDAYNLSGDEDSLTVSTAHAEERDDNGEHVSSERQTENTYNEDGTSAGVEHSTETRTEADGDIVTKEIDVESRTDADGSTHTSTDTETSTTDAEGNTTWTYEHREEHRDAEGNVIEPPADADPALVPGDLFDFGDVPQPGGDEPAYVPEVPDAPEFEPYDPSNEYEAY